MQQQSFLVYYWVQHADKGHSICETVTADSVDHATELVHKRLEDRFLVVDSMRQGRVILQTQHIQYVEIEIGSCGPDDALGPF